MDDLRVIGHRGARGLAPENTIASFKKALECGVYGIEFDVRVTEDGIPVVLHDRDFLTPDGRQLVATLKYTEIKALKNNLLTFEEAMDFLYGKTNLFIDIRLREPAMPILKVLIKYLSPAEKSVHIGSFDFQVLKEVRKQLPDIGIIVNDQWSGIRARHRAKALDASIIDLDYRVLWTGYIAAVSRNSQFKLCTYTLNDPRKAYMWAKHGLKYVVTDYPDRFKH